MEYHLLLIFTLINLAMVATHATLPPEVYWKSVLPTTPMPKAITDILHPDWVEEKNTNVDVRKGGGVTVHTKGPKGKGPDPFLYNYAANETQLHDNPNVALFLLEKDLHVGSKLDLQFTKSSNNDATFLPRQVADFIPFSSNKVDDIFNMFSVKAGSVEGEAMKKTIKECEDSGIKGEEKYCATSLESMVDFSTSKLGKNVEAVSTEVVEKETKLQKYTITKGVKKIAGDEAVVCHKQNYPYVVFYCHKTDSYRAYSVPLEGVDGTRVKAVAVCHTDTSQWNPKHIAFQVLKVKPGTVPICHILPEDHVVWVPKH